MAVTLWVEGGRQRGGGGRDGGGRRGSGAGGGGSFVRGGAGDGLAVSAEQFRKMGFLQSKNPSEPSRDCRPGVVKVRSACDRKSLGHAADILRSPREHH